MKRILLVLFFVLPVFAISGFRSIICNNVVGIDVSHHQGNINWASARRCLPRNSFVYIKCTEGSDYSDPMFNRHATNAKKAGFLIGGYHYFRMTSGSVEQFLNFKNALCSFEQDLIPMVDVETDDGTEKPRLQDSLQVFLNLLEKHYGKKPMIYGTMRSYNTYCAPKFNSYPLYIGRYNRKAPVIKGKQKDTYTIWQYSETGKIKGIHKPVDLCRFHPARSISDILL